MFRNFVRKVFVCRIFKMLLIESKVIIFSIQKWNIFEHFRIEKNRDKRIVIFRIIFDQFWLNTTKLIGNIISKNGRKKCIFTFFDRKS